MSLEGRGSARRQVILEVSPRAGGRAGRRRRGEGEPTCTDARVFVGPPCSSTIFHANDGVTPISGEAKDRMGAHAMDRVHDGIEVIARSYDAHVVGGAAAVRVALCGR